MSKKNHKAARFSPQGELTIYTAEEQKARLMKVIEDQQLVEIDLSKITEMDTAGLQLLILAKREATQRALPFSIVEHSAATLEVIDLCNMAGFFGEQVFIPSENPARGQL